MTLLENVIRLSRSIAVAFVFRFEILTIKLVRFARNNCRKLSAISMASKMLTITALFAVMPINTKPLNGQVYNTNIKFDAGSPLAIMKTQKEVKIEVAESDFDRNNREQSLAQAKTAPKAVSQNVTVSYNDPSDFRAIYKQAGMQFGIPWQLIEAVHQVESGKSGSTTTRSYAGAQGPMQFMPGTWRHYGIDGNGDGVADANNVVDAIYGGANLLAQSGAAEGDIDGALLNYNHAMWYVNKVKAVAYEIGM